jgi:hypothetical protein
MISKTIFLISVLFVSMGVVGQPKNATTIIIQGVDLKTVTTAMLDMGYFIDKYEPELGTAITLEKEFKNGIWYLKLKVRVKDSTAFISGDLKVMISPFGDAGKTFDPVVNRGMKGSPYKTSFGQMMKLAASLNKPTTYK